VPLALQLARALGSDEDAVAGRLQLINAAVLPLAQTVQIHPSRHPTSHMASRMGWGIALLPIGAADECPARFARRLDHGIAAALASFFVLKRTPPF